MRHTVKLLALLVFGACGVALAHSGTECECDKETEEETKVVVETPTVFEDVAE